jgi:Tol biopolymer transport system component
MPDTPKLALWSSSSPTRKEERKGKSQDRYGGQRSGALAGNITDGVRASNRLPAALGLAVAAATASPALACDLGLRLASHGPSAIQGNSYSSEPSISVDGREVAFSSAATNLVAGDTNRAFDIFVYDRLKDATELVSAGMPPLFPVSTRPSGATVPANGGSARPSISANGDWVAFESHATNLIPPFDRNGAVDIFVYDRDNRVTALVSVSSDGIQGDGASFQPSISADGIFVAFSSVATNLVAGDTNGTQDIFVHDRDTDATELVSVSSDGMQGDGPSYQPSISAHGRYVAFSSAATNLVAGDTNRTHDIFVYDREKDVLELVSVRSDGIQGNGASHEPSISWDGRYVAFSSAATNLVAGDTNGTSDIFVHDRDNDATELVSVSWMRTQGDGSSVAPSISPDGRYVAFSSAATNLDSWGDTNRDYDVFVHDRDANWTELVSVRSDRIQGNSYSSEPSITLDGDFVAFSSHADNLLSSSRPDLNGATDVFLKGRY